MKLPLGSCPIFGNGDERYRAMRTTKDGLHFTARKD